MAAQASQPAISAVSQWPSETPGPKPVVSLPLRKRRQAANAQAVPTETPESAVTCPQQSREGQRAPSEFEMFFCERPGCDVHFTRTSRSPCQRFCSPSCHQALPESLNENDAGANADDEHGAGPLPGQHAGPEFVDGYFHRVAPSLELSLPAEEEGAGGLRRPPGSPLPFSNSCSRRRGDDSLRRRSGISCATR